VGKGVDPYGATGSGFGKRRSDGSAGLIASLNMKQQESKWAYRYLDH
jgi:hypothetical protein